MIHPSYSELMQVVSKGADADEMPPVVKSRYSIVLATSKRAREIIGGSRPLVDATGKKPLSVAIEELYKEKVKIVAEESDETKEEE